MGRLPRQGPGFSKGNLGRRRLHRNDKSRFGQLQLAEALPILGIVYKVMEYGEPSTSSTSKFKVVLRTVVLVEMQ